MWKDSECGKFPGSKALSRVVPGIARVVPALFSVFSRVLPGFISLISREFPGFEGEIAFATVGVKARRVEDG
jgi:hypothetical protein